MINCIVFDIGNVLLYFKPMEYLKSLFPSCSCIEELHREIFQSSEWIELDRGTLTQEQFIDILIQRHPGHKDAILKTMDGWLEILTPMEDTLNIINRLDFIKYKILLLSNFHSKAYEHIINKYDFFKSFHGGIISCKEKMVKPDDEIFHCLIERYKLIPQKSIFIDDTEVNTDAAARLGFNTIQFTDAEELKSKLIEFGVL